MAERDINIILERLRDSDADVQRHALTLLAEEIYETQGVISAKSQELLDVQTKLAACLGRMNEGNKRRLYDLLSVMSVLDESTNCLRYKLNGNPEELEEWNHQYVKKLVKGILDVEKGQVEAECYEPLIEPIVHFLLRHNSEVEAIDFIVEVSRLPSLDGAAIGQFSRMIQNMNDPTKMEKSAKSGAVQTKEPRMGYFNLLIAGANEDNRERILVYLWELSFFYDLRSVLIPISAFDPSRYLVALIKYGLVQEAIDYVRGTEDRAMRAQLQYILARCSIYYECKNEDERKILSNSHMKDVFSAVACSLETLPPKKLEYMFKGLNKDRIDIAAIANGFVHFAYARDPVFFPCEGDFKIKEEYAEQLRVNKSISTMASIGLLSMFDPAHVRSVFSTELFETPEIGAVLALAIASIKGRDEDTSVLNLLSVFLNGQDPKDTLAALMGIALVYAGRRDQDVYNIVFPLLSSSNANISLYTIYVLGAVFPGDMVVLTSCLDVYEQLQKETPFSNFAILGIALFFYGQPINMALTIGEGTCDGEDGVCNKSKVCKAHANAGAYSEEERNLAAIFNRLDRHSQVLALGFMYIGTGNTGIVDHVFSRAFVGEIDALLESLGLLSCCLIGMGDSLATQLLERISTSSLLLDSPHLKNIVPLCMGLLYASNPRPEVVDILEKAINSGESNVNSLIGLGVVGAGSCSSRILRILDANFCHVYKDAKASASLICAQGLVNLGKGLFSLSPLCYDNHVILYPSITGLVSTFFTFLETGMFKDYPFLILAISEAVVPKYIAGADGYTGVIRVGKPVDTVGLVGHPKKISASIVHNLPIVINGNERAETEDPVCTFYIEDVLVRRQ